MLDLENYVGEGSDLSLLRTRDGRKIMKVIKNDIPEKDREPYYDDYICIPYSGQAYSVKKDGTYLNSGCANDLDIVLDQHTPKEIIVDALREHYSETVDQLHYTEMEIEMYSELITQTAKKLRRARKLKKLLSALLETFRV